MTQSFLNLKRPFKIIQHIECKKNHQKDGKDGKNSTFVFRFVS